MGVQGLRGEKEEMMSVCGDTGSVCEVYVECM